MNIEKKVAIVGSMVTAVALVAIIAVAVYLAYFGEISSDSFRVGFRTFEPERIVLSEDRVGEPLGALEEDLPFESVPYGKTDTPVLIPAGTSYYAVEGFEKEHYLALPYEGFYFLYSTEPNKRIVLEPLPNDDALEGLREEYAGTQAQACYEAFAQEAGWKMSYCFLWIDGLDIDDPAALLRMISAYCDNRGIAVVISPDFEMLRERGYWQDDAFGGFGAYVDGLTISLSHFTIGTGEKPGSDLMVEEIGPDGSVVVYEYLTYEDLPSVAYEGEVSIETGVTAGSLAGSGYIFVLELIDGAWVIRTSEMTWIS